MLQAQQGQGNNTPTIHHQAHGKPKTPKELAGILCQNHKYSGPPPSSPLQRSWWWDFPSPSSSRRKQAEGERTEQSRVGDSRLNDELHDHLLCLRAFHSGMRITSRAGRGGGPPHPHPHPLASPSPSSSSRLLSSAPPHLSLPTPPPPSPEQMSAVTQ